MWDTIKQESEAKGIEEIGEASASFEHCFKFLGTWRIKKAGIAKNYIGMSGRRSSGWRSGGPLLAMT